MKTIFPTLLLVILGPTDSDPECELVRDAAVNAGASSAVICNNWALGGLGSLDLADAVVKATSLPSSFRHIYELEATLHEKIEIIARDMYGASSVEMSEAVLNRLSVLEKQGYGNLPVCMSKTALSLSGDPALKGVPTDFKLRISDAYLSAGAGFVITMVGEISKMPGLPTRPCIYDIDLDTGTGLIHGLF